jgi:mRNA interferase RelE/StbE
VTRRLEYSTAALRDLERMHPTTRRRVWERLRALADDPRPSGCEALQGGLAGYLKVRVGDYRIVYVVEEEVVFVTRVGHRGSIYRELGRG